MPQAKLGKVMLRHDLRGLQRSLVIASGDKDVLPLANVAHQLGWIVEMAAFELATATTTSVAVDKVRPLDGLLDQIGHCAFPWP